MGRQDPDPRRRAGGARPPAAVHHRRGHRGAARRAPPAAAAPGEWGDRPQTLVVALAVRYRRPLPILAGVLVAALANSLIAAFGGSLVQGMIGPRAASLLVAVALVYAGVAGFIRPKPYESAGTSRAG